MVRSCMHVCAGSSSMRFEKPQRGGGRSTGHISPDKATSNGSRSARSKGVRSNATPDEFSGTTREKWAPAGLPAPCSSHGHHYCGTRLPPNGFHFHAKSNGFCDDKKLERFSTATPKSKLRIAISGRPSLKLHTIKLILKKKLFLNKN
jgi:hypothetical protein